MSPTRLHPFSVLVQHPSGDGDEGDLDGFQGGLQIVEIGGRMVWYGMVNVDLYSAIITKVSNALNTLVSGEKPGFQTLSKGLIVLLCAEVVRQRVPDHGAGHSKCSASDSG